MLCYNGSIIPQNLKIQPEHSMLNAFNNQKYRDAINTIYNEALTEQIIVIKSQQPNISHEAAKAQAIEYLKHSDLGKEMQMEFKKTTSYKSL
jgi:hypothetical protein